MAATTSSDGSVKLKNSARYVEPDNDKSALKAVGGLWQGSWSWSGAMDGQCAAAGRVAGLGLAVSVRQADPAPLPPLLQAVYDQPVVFYFRATESFIVSRRWCASSPCLELGFESSACLIGSTPGVQRHSWSGSRLMRSALLLRRTTAEGSMTRNAAALSPTTR